MPGNPNNLMISRSPSHKQTIPDPRLKAVYSQGTSPKASQQPAARAQEATTCSSNEITLESMPMLQKVGVSSFKFYFYRGPGVLADMTCPLSAGDRMPTAAHMAAIHELELLDDGRLLRAKT